MMKVAVLGMLISVLHTISPITSESLSSHVGLQAEHVASRETLVAQEPVRILDAGHSDTVSSVSFSPDGRFLASGSWDGLVNIWELQTGKLFRTLQVNDDSIMSVAFSPNGKLLAAGGRHRITLWDSANLSQLQTFSFESKIFESADSIAIDREGHLLAASVGLTIYVWDLRTSLPLHNLHGHKFSVNKIALSPDGKLLSSSSNDSTVKLWDSSTGRLLRTLKAHEGFAVAVVFSPTGDVLASASNDAIKLWNPRSGRLLYAFGHTGKFSSPDAGPNTANYVNDLAFSPDGRLLAAANTDGTVELWEVEARRKVAILKGHTDAVASVAFAPDGSKLASGSYDYTFRLWEVPGGLAVAESARYLFSEDVGVKILFPRDWAKADESTAQSPGEPDTLVLKKLETLASIRVLHERLEAPPDMYKQLVEAAIAQSAQDYHKLREEKIARDGVDGVRLAISFKAGELQLLGYLDIFSIDKDHYRIQSIAPAEFFQRYATELNQIAQSVQFPKLHISPDQLPLRGSVARPLQREGWDSFPE